jgi:hypothetical protein
VNHIPVLGPFFLAFLLIVGLIRRSREILRLALVLVVVLPAVTYGVQLTGESAEHALEDEPWFDEDRVHEHEERAEAALIVSGIAGVLALVALWASRKGVALKPAMAILVLLATLVTGGFVAVAALDGGMIRHEELRPPVESMRV